MVTALFVGLILALWQGRRATYEQDARRQAYAAQLNVAFQELKDHDLGQARYLLDSQRPKPRENDLRGFEWRHLWQRCQGDDFASFRDAGARGAAFCGMANSWFTQILAISCA